MDSNPINIFTTIEKVSQSCLYDYMTIIIIINCTF